MLIAYLIIFGSLVLDQLSKIIIELTVANGAEFFLIKDFLYITRVYNTGAAWSMMNDSTLFLAIVSLTACIIFSIMLKNVKYKERKIYYISLSMIIGGTAGNMIDRFMCAFKLRKGVIDFIGTNFGSYSFPIFNVADSCLVIGVILLSIDILIFDDIRKKRQSKETTTKVVEEANDETTNN